MVGPADRDTVPVKPPTALRLIPKFVPDPAVTLAAEGVATRLKLGAGACIFSSTSVERLMPPLEPVSVIECNPWGADALVWQVTTLMPSPNTEEGEKLHVTPVIDGATEKLTIPRKPLMAPTSSSSVFDSPAKRVSSEVEGISTKSAGFSQIGVGATVLKCTS